MFYIVKWIIQVLCTRPGTFHLLFKPDVVKTCETVYLKVLGNGLKHRTFICPNVDPLLPHFVMAKQLSDWCLLFPNSSQWLKWLVHFLTSSNLDSIYLKVNQIPVLPINTLVDLLSPMMLMRSKASACWQSDLLIWMKMCCGRESSEIADFWVKPK